MRRIAIIPARGGSKRIPNKNIREFCGKPMIGHILAAARDSDLFDIIHVSTDSDAIADTSAHLGFAPDFPRPTSLADDQTPIMPVVTFAVEEYLRQGQSFDQVWLLMACSPLLTAQNLIEAEAVFVGGGGERPLLAVSRYPVPVEWAFTRRSDGGLEPVQPGAFSVRSQDLEPKYFDAGAFAVFPTARALAAGTGSDSGFLGYVLPKGGAIDIDDEEDWALAEALFRQRAARVEAPGQPL